MIDYSDSETITDNQIIEEDASLDLTLRPQSLTEFIGQQTIKDNLSVVIKAAKMRQENIEHMLLYGPPGLGKTTLAHIVAQELNSNLKTTSGPAIEKAGDLAALLTNLSEGDVLFIDEIHRLNKTVEEILYPALEDKVLDIMIGKGPGARSVRMDLPNFTLIGATTRLGLLSAPLRDRFGLIYHLDYYPDADLTKIVKRSASIIDVSIDADAAEVIASCSRFTPRITNRLLKRVRDFAQVAGQQNINLDHTKQALASLQIDSYGLDKHDRKILEIIITQFKGGPVGVNSIAAATGEEPDTISEVHEPFLIRSGFISRTPKGRQVTDLAYSHLNITKPV
ncbi:MAG: Holliday junction branch migration DNA helicase RuvB [Candidatus Doudnabacteria bacterium]